MVGNEQENTEKDEEKINKEDKQEGSERIGVEYFIAIFGVFSTLYYTITIKSDIEIMNGELKYRIDTVKGMINLIDNEFDAIQTIVGGANNAWVVNEHTKKLLNEDSLFHEPVAKIRI
ncbi:unnamed protein product [Rhizophagus irregularis]|nr:unnamed protein product [Rhizophagus irregularis]